MRSLSVPSIIKARFLDRSCRAVGDVHDIVHQSWAVSSVNVLPLSNQEKVTKLFHEFFFICNDLKKSLPKEKYFLTLTLLFLKNKGLKLYIGKRCFRNCPKSKLSFGNSNSSKIPFFDTFYQWTIYKSRVKIFHSKSGQSSLEELVGI